MSVGALERLVANISPSDAHDATDSARISDLQPSPFQPRRQFDDARLASLAESIRQQGVLQPLVVRRLRDGTLEVVSGERRLRAARLAGLESVPVTIRDVDDARAALIAAVENLQREDLNVIDEVDATVTLVAGVLGVPVHGVRARLGSLNHDPESDPEAVAQLEQLFAQLGQGQWRSFVKNKMRILGWPESVLSAMREHGLGYSVAGLVAAAPLEHQAAMLDLALGGATKAELQSALERLTATSFRKDVDMEAARRVARTVTSRRALDRLDEGRRREVAELLQRLDALLKPPTP